MGVGLITRKYISNNLKYSVFYYGNPGTYSGTSPADGYINVCAMGGWDSSPSCTLTINGTSQTAVVSDDCGYYSHIYIYQASVSKGNTFTVSSSFPKFPGSVLIFYTSKPAWRSYSVDRDSSHTWTYSTKNKWEYILVHHAWNVTASYTWNGLTYTKLGSGSASSDGTSYWNAYHIVGKTGSSVVETESSTARGWTIWLQYSNE